MLGGTGGFSAAGGTVQPQPSAAAGRITASMADDLTAIQFNEEIQNEANMYFQQVSSFLSHFHDPNLRSRRR